jgi:hypothetical protein
VSKNTVVDSSVPCCNNSDLKELRELGYDNVADEIAQGLQHYDDRLALNRTPVSKRYVQGQYGIELHLSSGWMGIAVYRANTAPTFISPAAELKTRGRERSSSPDRGV